MAMPQERLRTIERTAPGVVEASRVSWGGVWSGFLVGVGTLMLLGALALAVGITAADVGSGEGAGAKGLGIGAAIWAFLSMLIAYFLGGAVAARMGMIFDTATASLHGVLVWALGALSTFILATVGVSLGMSAVFGVAGGVAKTAVTSSASGLSEISSGDVDQVLARLNDAKTVQTVAAATGMSEQEARAQLTDIRQRVEAARSDPARAAAEARDGLQRLAARTGERVQAAAQAAQPAAAATSWATFGALVIALLAAVGGATWGGRRARFRAVEG